MIPTPKAQRHGDRSATIAVSLAALSDADIAHLIHRIGAPLVRSGPPGLVAWYAALARCVAAERLARRGGGDPGALRDAAERVLLARTAALPLPERVALRCALTAQQAPSPVGELQDLGAALIRVLSPVSSQAVGR